MEISRKTGKLASKKIALCLTGSVACIESPKLARELRRYGADVTCYMTQAAVDYGVSPHVMEWATGKPVILKLTGMAEHLKDYDLVIIYPATMNVINKIALGVADNVVTTLCAATDPTRLLIAPAMNLKLYNNESFRENLEKLKKLGVTFVEPRISEGSAKVAPVEEVIDYAIRCLTVSKLRGRGVLILAGPTRYDLDPIRYISNKSSGKLGLCLAKEAFHRGSNVTVIYGPGSVSFPRYIKTINAYTVEDMLNETMRELEKGIYEIAIFSAAVLDFKPASYINGKVKSGKAWNIELIPTPKIIEEVSRKYSNVMIVGFKLEYGVSEDYLIERGKEELARVGASLVVANDLSKISEGRHKAYLISCGGNIIGFDGSKEELAKEIFDFLERII
ncbi:MAG: bifunctional phosphopantothenoylcysteine decarboxylase/phosphopantothenate--cysteine ligase CoaBC [Candidatus Bathyarchaeia archaeon]